MSRAKKIATAAAAAIVGASLVGITTQASAASPKMEKCYGIVKAKKNDCGTPKHACAAQATKSGSAQEWMYVVKGNCNKIVGGSLTVPKGKKKS